jgi:hypothetical protein
MERLDRGALQKILIALSFCRLFFLERVRFPSINRRESRRSIQAMKMGANKAIVIDCLLMDIAS